MLLCMLLIFAETNTILAVNSSQSETLQVHVEHLFVPDSCSHTNSSRFLAESKIIESVRDFCSL